MEKNEMLVVHIDEEGVIHGEDGDLIVGDMDIVRAALDMWGGKRQRGRVEIKMYLISKGSVNVSPDLNGTYAEVSEPRRVQ